MGLDTIRQAVLEAAQAEAARIIHVAQKRASERLEAQKELARQDAEREYVAKTRAIEEDYARKLVQFKGAAGKQLLDKRNALLADVFARARAQILSGPSDEYAKVMRALLERASGGLGGKVRVHTDDRAAFAKLIADLDAARASQDQLVLDQEHTLPERGGFVFVSDDFEIDQTLSTLLSDIEHHLTPAIAAELFRAENHPA